MIVRISADGQYEIDPSVMEQLNAIDDDLEVAVQARDEEAFRRDLRRLLALVRETGEPLEADHLAPSELILPPDDISLSEIAGELSTDGLIPG